MKTQITNLIKWQNLLKELQETKSNIESFEVSNILEEFNEDFENLEKDLNETGNDIYSLD